MQHVGGTTYNNYKIFAMSFPLSPFEVPVSLAITHFACLHCWKMRDGQNLILDSFKSLLSSWNAVLCRFVFPDHLLPWVCAIVVHHKGLAPAIAAAAAVVPLCRNTNCTFATFAFLSHLWEKNLFSEEHSVQPALEDSILHEACRLHRLGSTLDSCDTQLQAVSPFLLPNDGHLSQLFLFRSGTSFSRVTNNIAGAGTSVTINCLHSESFFSAEIVPIQSEMFKA